MKDNGACADYFKSQSGWNRFFLLMKSKWESLGRVGGKVCLKKSTLQERASIGRFLGRIIEDETVEISLAEFENALKRTRFSETSFTELLEAYFGEKLVSKADRKITEEYQREAFFKKVEDCFRQNSESGRDAAVWIHEAYKRQEYGYSLIVREMYTNEEQAFSLLEKTGRALGILEALSSQRVVCGIPLAVLAARVSGNPHDLDRGTVSGRLLMNVLCFLQQKKYPDSALAWKQRLAAASVLPDNISSQVTVYGIHLERENGTHQAAEAFCRMHEPFVLTAYNVSGLVRAYAEDRDVFIVENEMVFDYLIEAVHSAPISILCTSGQLHATALELLELLVKENCCIHYSGDLDPEGMGIADRLWQKYPEHIQIWRMSTEDYEKSVSHEKAGERSMAMLNRLCNKELKKTAELLKREKHVGYQENLLQELKQDLYVHINSK